MRVLVTGGAGFIGSHHVLTSTRRDRPIRPARGKRRAGEIGNTRRPLDATGRR